MQSRKSPLPRYYQLKEIMREKVTSGDWKPGDLIPSERELGEQYGISRMTARQALTELVNEGLFYREQGKGTFVSRNKITQQLIRLTGFTEDISARGQAPATRVLSMHMIPATEDLAERLRLHVGQPIFRLQRLRLADNEPLAIERSHLSFIGCERLLDEDLETQSLYRVLESRYGIQLIQAEQELEAGLTNEEDAKLLNLPIGSPALYTRRTTYTNRDLPIEYARSVYCGHKYTFYTHMLRNQLVP
ncbi:GntR family transcriptional regulator [Ktedonobacter racemifer]|jgi:GntR family transcriptional regulator|uniref:Transcriptional regulator, GntR family n=1 Tax=Ktedonobacter racemifer DSM 44963 TaxID=485913 RepID=D6TM24_KTERA|nr:GntR family transcriptional regulator [Ktedonobacter racemifer]EFH86824.1 transcriptional regulator, GntR family [Ktedonobacter racemifer DSM 44963]